MNVATVDTDQTALQQDDATSTVAQSPSLTIVKSLTNADDAVVDTAGETSSTPSRWTTPATST